MSNRLNIRTLSFQKLVPVRATFLFAIAAFGFPGFADAQFPSGSSNPAGQQQPAEQQTEQSGTAGNGGQQDVVPENGTEQSGQIVNGSGQVGGAQPTMQEILQAQQQSAGQVGGPNVVGVQPGSAANAATAVGPHHRGVIIGEPMVHKWKVGVFIKTGNKPCKNVKVTIPVPTDWDEQTVQIDSEDIPAEVTDLDYRDGESGLRQIVATMRSIAADTELTMTVTYKVQISSTTPPSDISMYTIPERPDRDIRPYLGSSPGISYRNSKLKKQVKAIMENNATAWSQVEGIYNWIRENIEYRDMEQADSISAFQAGEACAEDMVGLFVAMCRSQKIPARMVWVDGHQYAEFYLVDEANIGHWFPCNVAGLNDFGGISDPRVIVQKGDDIDVPEKADPQRYVAEFLSCSGNARPGIRFIRELLPN